MTVLAEKLAARKDLVTRIGQLDDEIAAALIYEEGDTPEETQKNLATARSESSARFDELYSSLNALQAIENDIRAANSITKVVLDGDEITLSEAIVLRDRLKTEHDALKKIADSVDEVSPTRGRNRYGFVRERRKKDEVNQRSVTPVREIRDDVDRIAKKLRLLDAEIQKINWSTEV